MRGGGRSPWLCACASLGAVPPCAPRKGRGPRLVSGPLPRSLSSGEAGVEAPNPNLGVGVEPLAPFSVGWGSSVPRLVSPPPMASPAFGRSYSVSIGKKQGGYSRVTWPGNKQ